MRTLVPAKGDRPIRARLARDLALLLLLVGGMLAGIGALLMERLRGDLADERIAAAVSQVRDEVRALLRPVEQQLLIVRDGLEVADLAPRDEQELNERLIPVLSHIPQIAGAIDADTYGAEYFLSRTATDWLTRLRSPVAAPVSGVHDLEADRAEPQRRERGSPITIRAPALVQGRAARPASGHLERALCLPFAQASPALPRRSLGPRVHPGPSPGRQTPPVRSCRSPDRVTALDVTLDTIVDSIEHLDLGAEGRAFLVGGTTAVFSPARQARCMARPRKCRRLERALFSAEMRLGGPVAFDAVAAWKAGGPPCRGDAEVRKRRSTWWAGFAPSPTTRMQPGSESPCPPPKPRRSSGATGIWCTGPCWRSLAVGVALAMGLVRKYSRQLRDLPRLSIDRADPESDLRELIAGGEGAHLELQVHHADEPSYQVRRQGDRAGLA